MSSHAHVGIKKRRADRKKRKDRLCVIALAVERRQDGETLVTVWPVTRRPPNNAAAGVDSARRQNGERSWVIVSEGDQFVWPGYDLRKVRGADRYDYGYLPPRSFQGRSGGVLGLHKAHKVTVTPR